MGTHKLFLFAKNTDANASIRGYNYQTLKTLETWLKNSTEKNEDEIYCDYEDDIFQRNEKKVKFRQLKLYSSNFSFKSEEIEKCIAHFFLLHVKTEYASIKKQFVFESNSRIANMYLDNDAELLKEWWENQDSLSSELLERCRDKIKLIVSNYIVARQKELKDSVAPKLLQSAIDVFASIKDSDWETFIKMIRWKFLNVSPDQEFSQTIASIESLLMEHQIPVNKNNLQAAFGILYKEVSLKASSSEPSGRKLTGRLLEKLLLTISSEEDKWYAEVFNKWENVKGIKYFKIGEFYEVLNASRFCRRSHYLTTHDKSWLSILDSYIDTLSIPAEFKLKAIYEHLWLRFRPDDNFKLPTGTLVGSEHRISVYFADFSLFRNADELEDAQSLLHITFTALMSKKANIEPKQLVHWFKQLYRILNEHLLVAENPNERCHLYEELGIFSLFLSQRKPRKKDTAFLKYFNNVLEILDEADLYHASLLADRINKYIKLFITIIPEHNEPVITALEEFSEKLDVQVQKREGKYKRAKQRVERGVAYIQSKNQTLLLKALDYFHEAKDLFNHKETIEGHILALINISQLYSSINLNFAAKYYALAAAWVSVHNGDTKLYKRIGDAFAMLFYTDFKQGSWLSALSDFKLYFNARQEFDTRPMLSDDDPTPFRSISDFAIVLYSSPLLSDQLKPVVDNVKSQLGQLGTDFVNPTLEYLAKEYPDKEAIQQYLQERLDDFALNDVSPVRGITFNALGCDWFISFSNTFEMNSIGEEFVAVLQIMVTEVFLSNTDFHLPKSRVTIQIEQAEGLKQPEQLPSNSEYKWKIFLSHFDVPKPKKINEHFATISASLMYVFSEISLLPYKEFQTAFTKLFSENALAQKALTANSYQRIYRYLLSKEQFDKFEREKFAAFVIGTSYPKPNTVLSWRGTVSFKYDRDKAIQNIRNRFKNSLPCIYITLSKLRPQREFREYVKELRGQGWHDWQIVLAMMNFIINYKVQLQTRTKTFASEDEHYIFVRDEFFRFLKIDEKKCYVEFPLEAFKSEEFDIALQQFPINALSSWGLENRSRIPNFEAIREFLAVRFKMNTDTTNDGNPLSDI